MKISYTDSFFSSLKKIAKRNRWWYKTLDTLKYDIPSFFRNVWMFRKSLWKFRPWDSGYNLALFKTSLQMTLECIENGHEELTSRGKKVEKMKRAIELLENFEKDVFIDMAESEIGEIKHTEMIFTENAFMFNETEEERAHNRRVFERAREIENAQWEELWTIVKGQPEELFRQNTEKNHEEMYEEWAKLFDGSGMLGWWT